MEISGLLLVHAHVPTILLLLTGKLDLTHLHLLFLLSVTVGELLAHAHAQV
jgi:hypothetical protein